MCVLDRNIYFHLPSSAGSLHGVDDFGHLLRFIKIDRVNLNIAIRGAYSTTVIEPSRLRTIATLNSWRGFRNHYHGFTRWYNRLM